MVEGRAEGEELCGEGTRAKGGRLRLRGKEEARKTVVERRLCGEEEARKAVLERWRSLLLGE